MKPTELVHGLHFRTDVPVIDFTTARAIDDMVNDARGTGRHVFVAGVRERVREMLEGQAVLDALPEGHDVDRRVQALRRAVELLNT